LKVKTRDTGLIYRRFLAGEDHVLVDLPISGQPCVHYVCKSADHRR